MGIFAGSKSPEPWFLADHRKGFPMFAYSEGQLWTGLPSLLFSICRTALPASYPYSRLDWRNDHIRNVLVLRPLLNMLDIVVHRDIREDQLELLRGEEAARTAREKETVSIQPLRRAH